MSNGIASIIEQLESQRAAIERALEALRGIEGITGPTAIPTKRRGRPPGTKNAPSVATKKKPGRPKKAQ
jgi:hypothetical protein